MDKRLTYASRILLLTSLASLPVAVIAFTLLWRGPFETGVKVAVTVAVALWWYACAAALHQRVVFPLRTLSNLLAALREGDFSLRARGASRDDALGEVHVEANALADVLREQRLGAVEAMALLRRVMAEVDVAVLAFDDANRLRLANRRAEVLLGRDIDHLLGLSVDDLSLRSCLDGDVPRLVEAPFPGSLGRWELRRGIFLERGVPQHLLIFSDLTRTLREEERQAWKRLLQVLRHEVNNSLAPIQSLATSLATLIEREPRTGECEQDLREGLTVIAERSRSLARFLGSYSRLAALPRPSLRAMRVKEWIGRVVSLERRLVVQMASEDDLEIRADPDLLEQMLINLIGNAVEAAAQTGGRVSVGWQQAPGKSGNGHLEVWVDDEGLGISNESNLFVPFYTTKPDGSGIGLVLSRQIAEAHGGTLTLGNREGSAGSRAMVRIPVNPG